MTKFISCDWGTSAFRIRLVETEKNIVIAEIRTEQGTASTFKLYTNSKTVNDKYSFYKTVLSEHIAMLEQQCGNALDDLAIVISGMASSSIGMIEVPYKALPFRTDGVDLFTHVIEPSEDFKHKIIIISGIKSTTDVMRGEETILIGCNAEYNEDEQVFIFPGTHSKHITVKSGTANDFKTYMTGEIFDLLCNKSILSASVEKDDSVTGNVNNPYFINGVIEGSESNLLHSLFHVRTNQLFKKLSNKENYQYLSGLLIGAELKTLLPNKFSSVTLVSSKALTGLYLTALQELGINKNLQQKIADEALVIGQSIIFMQHINST
ncbi:MAG: 2-dehydro-3-deoxygalactonokinase [Ginsengibacter sp.]